MWGFLVKFCVLHLHTGINDFFLNVEILQYCTLAQYTLKWFSKGLKKSAWKTFYDKLFFMWNIISQGQIQRFLTMGVQMYYNSTIS